MGATRNTGYIENLIAYDGNNNIGVGGPVNVLYKVTIGGNTLISGNLNVTGTITFSSNVTANSFVKNGGVATEFLKADGTVDTSTYATVSYVDTSISNLIDAAPAALNTLNELAAALGDDSSFSTTVTTALGNRLRIDTDAQGLTSEQKANGRTNLGVVIGTDVQAYDADLGAIAALAGTSGLLKKTAANTWTLDTNTYITGGFIGTTALQSSSATQAMTGISSIEFVGHVNDVAKIEVTTNAAITYFDFTLADDNNQEEWRWRFNPTGGTIYSAMRLVPTTNTTSNLIVSGTIAASNFSGSSSGTNTGDQDLSGYQPIDADLTAIAALSGTSGFLKKTAANSWSLDTNSYVDTINPQYISGYKTFYDGISVQPTNALTNVINFTASMVPTNANPVGANFGFTWTADQNNQTFSAVYISAASPGNAGSYTGLTTYALRVSGNSRFQGTVQSTGNITGANLSGTNTGDQTITLTGDVTGSGTGSFATTVNAYFDQRVYGRTDNYLGGFYDGSGLNKPNESLFGAGKLKIAMLQGSNLGFSGSWNDVLWISTYSGGDVKSSHALVFDKYSTDVWVSDQNFDSASWGTGYKLWHSGNLTNLNQLSNGPGYITSSATISGASGALSSRDNRVISPSEDNAAQLKFGFTSWNNNDAPGWADYLHLRSYSDNSGGNDNLIMFSKNGIGMRIWQQSYGSASAYSSYVDVWTTGNDGSGSGLDADLLDGNHASAFVTKDNNYTYGTNDYCAYDGQCGWHKIAEVVLNGNCQSYNFWGEYYDLGYVDHSRWSIGIVARAECDFTSNNESHHLRINITGLTTNDTGIEGKLRVVLTGSSSNYRKYEVQFYRESWDNGIWRFHNNQAWTVYTSRQSAGTPTGTSRAYYVGKLVSSSAYIQGTSQLNGQIVAGYSSTAGADYGNPLWIWSAPDLDAVVIQNTTAGGTPPKIYFRDTNGTIQTSNTILRLRAQNSNSYSAWLDNSTWNCSGDIVAYASDKRLKENITTISDAISKVKQLSGVTFDWSKKAEEVGFIPKKKVDEVGVIAQEVQAVLPQAIEYAPFDRNDDGTSKSGENYLTVKYEKIVPLLIEAIKEQQKQIEELKSQIKNK